MAKLKTSYNFGDTLRNGATVIEHNAVAGVLIAYFQGQFVTWRYSTDADTWGGHYHQLLSSAVDDYNQRVEERLRISAIS